MAFNPQKRILICAATSFEIGNLTTLIPSEYNSSFFVHGVGSTYCGIHLMQHLCQKSYDIVIQIGIAGAFENTNLKIGQVVQIEEDAFADLGIELANGTFQHIADAGFIDEKVLTNKNTISSIRSVKSITVNTTSGTESSIKKLKESYPFAQLESMEGAAFFAVCEQLNIQYYQIRSISNYVQMRDKSKWDIPLAIKNLHQTLVKLLNT